jgi:hypothetical protein
VTAGFIVKSKRYYWEIGYLVKLGLQNSYSVWMLRRKHAACTYHLLQSLFFPSVRLHRKTFFPRRLVPSSQGIPHFFSPAFFSIPNMVGRHISDELKEMALSMSLQGLRDSEVHEYTGISVRSLKRLRSTHRITGEVSRKNVAPGRPRALTSMQRKVRSITSPQFIISRFQIIVPL